MACRTTTPNDPGPARPAAPSARATWGPPPLPPPPPPRGGGGGSPASSLHVRGVRQPAGRTPSFRTPTNLAWATAPPPNPAQRVPPACWAPSGRAHGPCARGVRAVGIRTGKAPFTRVQGSYGGLAVPQPAVTGTSASSGAAGPRGPSGNDDRATAAIDLVISGHNITGGGKLGPVGPGAAGARGPRQHLPGEKQRVPFLRPAYNRWQLRRPRLIRPLELNRT
jgi:hypothetical protein